MDRINCDFSYEISKEEDEEVGTDAEAVDDDSDMAELAPVFEEVGSVSIGVGFSASTPSTSSLILSTKISNPFAFTNGENEFVKP